MENPCYKCGQTVEEGIPFCPHCSAPQIRVVLAEPPQPLAFAVATTSSDPAALPASQTIPVLAMPMQWSQTLKPCALAALIASVAMVLKLIVPLIALVGAGFFAVALYRRNSPGISVRAGAGARLGALSGLLCSAMTAVLGALRVTVLHEGEEIRKFLLDLIQQTALHYPDPQHQADLELLRSPTGMVALMIFILIAGFVLFLTFGTLGGALGGTVLGRRDKS
ncbi:MAG TPA: hypothetical protein VK812_21115 [Candidatus Binatus sp.]|jgi:hypothetical protein|nr:hypothetical protein [Candidatus Binatus sp.]